jgi:hypothetical protein
MCVCGACILAYIQTVKNNDKYIHHAYLAKLDVLVNLVVRTQHRQLLELAPLADLHTRGNKHTHRLMFRFIMSTCIHLECVCV